MSATPCWTSGWWAMESARAIDVRRGMALDGQVEGPLGRAQVGGGEAHQRPGEDRELERAGAGEAGGAHERRRARRARTRCSRTVSWLWVARMPSVSQVSMIWIPVGVAAQEAVDDLRVLRVATRPWRGSRRRSTPGERLPKILWPEISHPPSTRSAVATASSSGRSLPASPCSAAEDLALGGLGRGSSGTSRRRPAAGRRPRRSSSSACWWPAPWPGPRRRAGARARSTRRGPARRRPARLGHRAAQVARTASAPRSPRRRSGSPGRRSAPARRSGRACRR